MLVSHSVCHRLVATGLPLLAALSPQAWAAAQSNAWSQTPGALSGGFVWFDPVRRRPMLLDALVGKVSTLDGGIWRPQNYGAGYRDAMVFAAGHDPLRRQLIVTLDRPFNPNPTLPTTWSFDGQSWVGHTGPGAAAPNCRDFAFDPVRGALIGFSTSTWTWNGTSWLQLPSASTPPLRSATALATDRTRNRVVMFGGFDHNGGSLNDTWEWDGAQWHLAATSGPSPRRAILAFDPLAGRVVMLNGLDAAGETFDSYAWTGSQWTPRPNVPTSFAGAYDDGARLHAIADPSLGGANDDWLWDGSTWVLATRDVRRPSHFFGAIAYDPVRDRIVAHGGWTGYNFDGTTGLWDGSWHGLAVSGPSARISAAARFLPAHARVVLFGGTDLSTLFDDTWEWDGAAWSQLAPPTRPTPRFDHALIADGNGDLLLFGGSATADSTQLLQDTWRFDGTTWTLLPTPTAPPPRTQPAFAWDHLRQRGVLFGGFDSRRMGILDTWEFDGVAWQQRAIAQGPFGQSADFDLTIGRVATVDAQGVWSWDGNAWSLQPASNLPVNVHTVLFHGGRQRLLACSSPPDRVWTFGPTPAAFTVGTPCGQGPAIGLVGELSPGQTVTIEVATQPNAAGIIGFGSGSSPVPIGSGCSLQIDTIARLDFAVADAAGLIRLDIPVPNALALRGFAAAAQAGVLDGGPLGGGSLTGALRMTVGD